MSETRCCTLCGAQMTLELQPPLDLALDFYQASCPCGANYDFFYNRFSKLWQLKAMGTPRPTHKAVVRFDQVILPAGVELVSALADSAFLGLELFDPNPGEYEYTFTVTRTPKEAA